MMVRSSELRRLALFATLAPAELAAAAAIAQLCAYRHGERLFQAGDSCASVIIVLDGFVRLSQRTPDGAVVTTGIVRAGDLVAVTTLREQAEHDHSADALGRVRTIELPAPLLLDLVSRSPRLFAGLTRCLVARLDDAYRGVVADAHSALPLRVIHTLGCLTRPARSAPPEALRPLAVRLSHAEVARLVGADRATVTRLIGALAQQGLVRQVRGHIAAVTVVSAVGEERERGELVSWRRSG